jgi:superfamily II DNA or RNA helicase
MSQISFSPIPATSGEYKSNLELSIRTPNATTVYKLLTMRNKSVEWRVNFLKKKLVYWTKQLESDIPGQEAGCARIREKASAKIAEISAEIDVLAPQVKEELFTAQDDGSIVVPPGMWFLCDSIRENEHINNEIAPLWLHRCRDYQQEAVRELLKYKRATVELATGLGKSLIIQSMALSGVKAGMRVMIVVPSEYLVGQMETEMKALHPNTTAQGGGRQAKAGWDILVTTIQSAQMYADLPGMILLDESHHAPAETWTGLLCKADRATHVYSFTATAFRADGLDMAIHAFAGPVVYRHDVRWGIANGWLANFRVYSVVVTPKYHDQKRFGKRVLLSDHIQSTTAYKIMSGSVELMTVARDRLLAGMAKGRKIIVIFKTVEACKAFRKFCAPMIDLDVASAQEGKKSKAPLRWFREGKTQVLLANSGLIAEGVDLPDADMLILATQNSSDVTTLQMLGRVLRKPPGKKDAVVIDIQTNGYAQFERAGERRRALYAKITENLQTITVG